jgi:hypothetical protein
MKKLDRVWVAVTACLSVWFASAPLAVAQPAATKQMQDTQRKAQQKARESKKKSDQQAQSQAQAQSQSHKQGNEKPASAP